MSFNRAAHLARLVTGPEAQRRGDAHQRFNRAAHLARLVTTRSEDLAVPPLATVSIGPRTWRGW